MGVHLHKVQTLAKDRAAVTSGGWGWLEGAEEGLGSAHPLGLSRGRVIRT